MDVRELLVRSPFFGGLDDEAVEQILGMLKARSCPAGQTIFREGELGRSMYIVSSGDLVVGRTAESGRLIRLMHLGPGDVMGETTLIEMQPRSTTVLVVQPAVLHELTNANLYALHEKNLPAYVMVLQNINRELCRRLRKEEHHITAVADESEDETTQIRTRAEILGDEEL